MYIKKPKKPDDNPDNEPDDMVSEVQVPRKITLFRVVMERKLGIDWEHP
jgi:hypothetical protein